MHSYYIPFLLQEPQLCTIFHSRTMTELLRGSVSIGQLVSPTQLWFVHGQGQKS